MAISTQSNDPLHILSQLIDGGLGGMDPETATHLYTVPEQTTDGLFIDPKVWRLANPALGDFRSLEELRTAAGRTADTAGRTADYAGGGAASGNASRRL